jgi:hypothetical protein
MPIITDFQNVKADVRVASGVLKIDFSEDPSYTRSETVIIDLMQRSIGIIFQHGYHHIGDLPKSVSTTEVEGASIARLCGHGEMGREIVLHAPVKLVS